MTDFFVFQEETESAESQAGDKMVKSLSDPMTTSQTSDLMTTSQTSSSDAMLAAERDHSSSVTPITSNGLQSPSSPKQNGHMTNSNGVHSNGDSNSHPTNGNVFNSEVYVYICNT